MLFTTLESVTNMNVIEIKPNGFCNGVIRAIKMVDEIVDNKNTKQPIYMFGNLVHNKHVVDMYKDKVIIIKKNYEDELSKIDSGTVIFTAHGIKPSIINIAKRKGLDIVDTTCPNVSKIQKLIRSKIDEDYDVLVVGQSTHPEVLSYLGIDEKVKLYTEDFVPKKKTFIVNQTTLIYDDILKIYEKLKSTYEQVEIALEICNATKVRQQAISNYADTCDAFIIVGDPNSKNCNSLFEVAKSYKPAFKVETKYELKNLSLKKFKTIGVTAGASTPRILLEEVIEELKK